MGTLKDVPISFRALTISLAYLVIEGSPFDVIIGDPTMQILQTVIDLGRRQVRFIKEDHAVEL